MRTIGIKSDDEGMRLDRWLRRRLALKSLSEIYQLIRKGGVKVNGKKRKESYRLKEGDELKIAASAGDLDASSRTPSDAVAALIDTPFFRRNFKLLFEDDNLMVCDKPSDLVVHSGTGHLKHDSLIDLATSYLLRSSRGSQAFLVHRLDRDTSGVILIAKNRRILRALHEGFRARITAKLYQAFCHGGPQPSEGVVDVGLARDFDRRDGTKVQVSARGQRSLSTYRVLQARKGVSRVEVELQTGRTHQIRVHMAYLTCPVVGDVRYGDRERDDLLFANRDRRLRRLYLHAHRISFFYPDLNREVAFEASEPPEFAALWNSL